MVVTTEHREGFLELVHSNCVMHACPCSTTNKPLSLLGREMVSPGQEWGLLSHPGE